jgi:GT2 family glycosyltransferase
VSAARNAGIRSSKAEFILPLDSDNRVRDLYLSEGVFLLKNNPSIGVIYADAEYFGERNGRWQIPEFDLLSLVRYNFIDACALYRKSLWEEVGGYDEQMPWMGLEDWDFWLRLAARGATFVHLPSIGFDYRVRRDSLRTEGHRHAAELINHIFAKPELACYKLLRETNEEVHQLRGGIRTIQNSPSYRLGRGLLAPARLLRKLWRGVY